MIKPALKEIERCKFPGGYSPWKTRGDCTFDAHAARIAIEFFPRFLVHIKGQLAGKPLELEQWQKDIIGTLFGWKRPDGTRRYRTAYIEVPRKAGKSTLSAGIALLSLYLDDEPGAEIYSCAAEREQASIVFEIAKENVIRNPVLKERSKIYQKSIVVTDPRTGAMTGSYKVLSSDAHTKHGYNPSCVIFDELHAQPNPDLWEVMKTGMGARVQPLMIAITTAGFDRHSVCYQQHDRAKRIIDGTTDDETFLPVIYGADEDDDWTDEATWRKAQPNLDISVPVEFYRSECKVALDSPRFENTFRRLYLDQWTEQDVRWLNHQKWLDLGVDLGDLSGCLCFGGLDMANVQDLAAFSLLFPDEEEGRWMLKSFFWLPQETIHRRSKADGVPYDQWAKNGDVFVTPGDSVSYKQVRHDINELGERYNIKMIAADKWNATQLVQELDGDGFNIAMYPQGFAGMNGPSKELERLIMMEHIEHDNNPVMNWCIRNVATDEDRSGNGNIRPSKKKSKERIDGVVSAVMALGIAIANGEDGESIYEKEGNLAL